MESTLAHGKHAAANGIDIHYLERGSGKPLVLLHGGLVSSSPRWAGVPVSYASHLDTLARRFRVIAPDTRGCAQTAHEGDGTVSFALLADDVAALAPRTNPYLLRYCFAAVGMPDQEFIARLRAGAARGAPDG